MIDGLPIVGLTAPGLLLIAVWMVLTGRLVPRATLRDKIEEVKEWRGAYELERERSNLSVKQTGELLELAKTTDAFIRGVFKVSAQIHQSGGTDASSQS